MIAVIADDLTGAAELGGIGLRYNLNVEVALEVNPLSTADLLIISTDARSQTEEEAVALTAPLTRQIADMHPRLFFKKVDSVLRGHILSEIKAQLQALNIKKALIVSANPALGRTIQEGVYLIHGKPIEQTPFADDPEFPFKSSDVLKMLRTNDASVKVKKPQETLEEEGIVVGEAATKNDLEEWTRRFDENTLVAGGAGFFSALLNSLNIKKHQKEVPAPPFKGNKLYVCGTAFTSSAIRVAALAGKDGLVNYLPEALFSTDDLTISDIHHFGLAVSKQIRENGTAIIAVNPLTRRGKDITAAELRERTAILVQDISQKVYIDELVIEGGSTASAIFRAMGIKTLFPSNEYAPGVIRCRAGESENLYITLKPGSYNWPKEVWMF